MTSHVSPDGVEKPIAFASHTMALAKRNYSQVEREALAIIFGVKRFRRYLWGRHFTLETNHRPLVSILGPNNGIPTMTAVRLQRWALILSGYSYDITYRPGSELSHADALSRLPYDDPARGERESRVSTSSTSLVWTNCRSPVDRSENRQGRIVSWPRCTTTPRLAGLRK